MRVDRTRRRLLAAAAAALVVSQGRAQTWPARPIRIVCPLPPGGLTDPYSRAIAKRPTAPEEFLRLYRTEGPQWIAITRDLGITLD